MKLILLRDVDENSPPLFIEKFVCIHDWYYYISLKGISSPLRVNGPKQRGGEKRMENSTSKKDLQIRVPRSNSIKSEPELQYLGTSNPIANT